MTSIQNVNVIRQALRCFDEGNIEGYLELYDANVLFHGYPDGLPPGIEGLRLFYQQLVQSFSKARVVIEDIFGEGDRVALRYTMLALHTGAFGDVPPSGKEVVVQGQSIFRMHGDKCVQRWQATDMLGLLQQLGVVPKG